MREVEKEVMLEHWIRSDDYAESKNGKGLSFHPQNILLTFSMYVPDSESKFWSFLVS